MSRLSRSERQGFLRQLEPVTLLGAATLFTIPLLTTIDWLSAVVGIALAIALAIAARIPRRSLLARAWPILLAAPLAGVSMLLYAKPGGRIYLDLGFARVSDASIELALGISLRVLAIGLPTVLMLGGVDSTRLADGLAQIVRLPARFVLGALAAFRLVAVFRDDWTSLAQARRARGLGDGGRLRRFATMAFALLVLALRRGGDLATAMEARGFGGAGRTWARESRLRRGDWIFLAVALAGGIACVGVAVMFGASHFVGSGR